MLPQNDEYYSDRLSKFVAQEHFITCRLAQALHDQLGQTLTAISLLWGSRQQKCDSVTDGDIDILIRQAINELRDCLMVLRPPFIEEYGLLVALQNEINRQSTLSKCSYISLDANSECTELRWPPDVEFAVFMITREAILNALNHSEAKLIKVSVNGSARRLSVEIEDDGGGFDTQSPIGCAGHLGLVGMTDRAKAINAYLSINSKVTEGTCVQLRWNNSD
jgi:signal transduction histidine kinase